MQFTASVMEPCPANRSSPYSAEFSYRVQFLSDNLSWFIRPPPETALFPKKVQFSAAFQESRPLCSSNDQAVDEGLVPFRYGAGCRAPFTQQDKMTVQACNVFDPLLRQN